MGVREGLTVRGLRGPPRGRPVATGAARPSAALVLVAFLGLSGVATGDDVADGAAAAAADAVAQVGRGKDVFAFSCAVCHGATGRGFAEAILAFPDDYRDCARCHHPQNAPQMPGSEIMGSVMAFSLGDPPPLAEPERLLRFGTAAALRHYVRATMPRWAPRSLDDEAYLDVTAHLLRLVGWLGDDEPLTEELLSRPLGAY